MLTLGQVIILGWACINAAPVHEMAEISKTQDPTQLLMEHIQTEECMWFGGIGGIGGPITDLQGPLEDWDGDEFYIVEVGGKIYSVVYTRTGQKS